MDMVFHFPGAPGQHVTDGRARRDIVRRILIPAQQAILKIQMTTDTSQLFGYTRSSAPETARTARCRPTGRPSRLRPRCPDRRADRPITPLSVGDAAHERTDDKMLFIWSVAVQETVA
jgi:hypothetical protein